MKKIQGFTLAEVLITLAIIGVVAALTIPTLIRNYQKTESVVALKKIYSQLTTAIDKVMMDSNALKFTDVSLISGNNTDPKMFFERYFKVLKYCEKADYASCFPVVDTIDKNGGWNPASLMDYCVILVDGESLCTASNKNTSGITTFLVDTNGFKKPNTSGRDVFSFSVYYDGSVDELPPEFRDSKMGDRTFRTDNCGFNVYGGGCFTKIIDAGWKMDY